MRHLILNLRFWLAKFREKTCVFSYNTSYILLHPSHNFFLICFRSGDLEGLLIMYKIVRPTNKIYIYNLFLKIGQYETAKK